MSVSCHDVGRDLPRDDPAEQAVGGRRGHANEPNGVSTGSRARASLLRESVERGRSERRRRSTPLGGRRGPDPAVRRALGRPGAPGLAAGARPARRRGVGAGRVRGDARPLVPAARPRQGAGLPAAGGGQHLTLGPAPPHRRAPLPARGDDGDGPRTASPPSRAPRTAPSPARPATRLIAAARPAAPAPARGAHAALLPRPQRGPDRRRARHLRAGAVKAHAHRGLAALRHDGEISS